MTEASLSAQEVKHRAISGIAALVARSAAVRAMNLAASVVLARLLAPSQFGLLAIGLAISNVGGFLVTGGLGAALIRRRETPTGRQLEAVQGIQLAVALGVVALVAAIGIPLGTAGAIAAVMAVALPIDSLRGPSALVVERELHYRPVVRAEVGEMLAYNAVAVVAVALGAGVWGVAGAVVVRAVVGTVVLVRASGTGLIRPRPSWTEVRPLYRFALTLQGIELVNLLRDQGIVFAIGGIAGTAVLGIATFAQRLLQPIYLLFEASWRVSYPAMSRLLDQRDDLRATLERALALAATATATGVAPLIAAMPALVPSVFGPKWTPVVDMMPWVLGGVLLAGPISVCANGFFSAVGNARLLLWVGVGVALAWFVVGLPLLPVMGVKGIGVAWFAGGLVDLVWFSVALRRALGLRVLGAIAVPVAATAALAPVGWIAARTFSPTVVTAFLVGFGVLAAYVAVILVFQRAVVRDVVRAVAAVRGAAASGNAQPVQAT